LPSQSRQHRRIDREQDEIGLSREMSGCGFRDLMRRREMDVAVGKIDRRAAKHAVRLRPLPQGCRQNLENGLRRGHATGGLESAARPIKHPAQNEGWTKTSRGTNSYEIFFTEAAIQCSPTPGSGTL